MNRKVFFAVFGALSVVAVAVPLLLLKNRSKPGFRKEQPSDQSALTTMVGDDLPKPEQTAPDLTLAPVPDLDDGNERYLDADVVERLFALDARGEEDLVNEMADGVILLINHFVKEGYSVNAIRQIQRFYLSAFEYLKTEPIEQTALKIALCIPLEGATESGFSQTVAETFGWGQSMDFSYLLFAVWMRAEI